MKLNRVVSGITPSGKALHIGNYFGAVKQHIELQDQIEQTFYLIADLHALTTVKDKQTLESNIQNVILDYLALGLDPEKCTFFRQSDVPSHSQLAVVLANYISFAHMQRMHAYKDKLTQIEASNINMGLFNYPILMAADILLYKPDAIPVGEDQRQHVELTRDIAESFNKTYHCDLFLLPEPLISKETGKIIGTDGKRKMSKSLGNIIGIFDEENLIKKQIMSCYTDPSRKRSSDPGHIDGNPIFIYHDLINENKSEVADLKRRYLSGQVGDVEVKEKLIAAHLKYFKLAREKRVTFLKNPSYINDLLKKGAAKASKVATKTMQEVYQTIGIFNKLNS